MSEQRRIGVLKGLPAAIRKKREKGNTVDRCVNTLFLHQSQAELPSPSGSKALQNLPSPKRSSFRQLRLLRSQHIKHQAVDFLMSFLTGCQGKAALRSLSGCVSGLDFSDGYL
jgi:hypothetical protein